MKFGKVRLYKSGTFLRGDAVIKSNWLLYQMKTCFLKPFFHPCDGKIKWITMFIKITFFFILDISLIFQAIEINNFESLLQFKACNALSNSTSNSSNQIKWILSKSQCGQYVILIIFYANYVKLERGYDIVFIRKSTGVLVGQVSCKSSSHTHTHTH